MQKLKHIAYQKRNILLFVLAEIFIVVLYGLTAVAAFSPRELTFGENDMQLRRFDDTVTEGNYLDFSYTDVQAVVTPAFHLKKGIYYIEAVYERHGIVKAGLIYDIPRNGKDLVDNDEFELNPDKQTISYRVRIHDDSGIRFKLRLTGDAVEEDYIQLFQVRVVSSKLTYVYHMLWLIFALLIVDFLIWVYTSCYVKWEIERKIVFWVLAVTAFFMGLPLYQDGLSNGSDLSFHLSRLEGLYRSLKFTGGGVNSLSGYRKVG